MATLVVTYTCKRERERLNTYINIVARFVSTVGSNLFAFSWDLVMDWDLVQIDSYNNGMLLFKFRKNMHFSNPFWYVIAASINGCLRALKIGSHAYHVHPFCVDFAEIVRRWIWAIFRFENEWIKRSYIDIEVGNTMEETQHGRDNYVNTGNMLYIAPMASDNKGTNVGFPGT